MMWASASWTTRPSMYGMRPKVMTPAPTAAGRASPPASPDRPWSRLRTGPRRDHDRPARLEDGPAHLVQLTCALAEQSHADVGLAQAEVADRFAVELAIAGSARLGALDGGMAVSLRRAARFTGASTTMSTTAPIIRRQRVVVPDDGVLHDVRQEQEHDQI